jgi:ATP/maltotriose-dependent transcriptional regulator MalT
MSLPVLATKLFVPPFRSTVIQRQHLIERLNSGLHCKLILVSASAGFGKTTVVSEWVSKCKHPVLWLSLDEELSDSIRFLTYFISALQTVNGDIGNELLSELQFLQSSELESILSKILNEILTITDDCIFVLDDYHTLDSEEIDKIIAYILKNMPPNLHLVLITREDPHLPLARLRTQGQMIELRISDLRFTGIEVSMFLNKIMKLNLTEKDISALETKTEGWIAGLQLAALSMKGLKNSSEFIRSFTGSHHFILDYLIEEVLSQQSDEIQSFLIHTSILNRMCGPLCDAVFPNSNGTGQEVLKNLDKLNLFIIPLDNERKWYRYHHLFADLLRQRLKAFYVNETDLHILASQWYEDHNLYLEAFYHSTAAEDINRTISLLEGNGIPRHSRSNVSTILNWLQSLPETVMSNKPLLWIMFGSVLLGTGQVTGVEEKLQAAEIALDKISYDDNSRDLIGRIASMRAIIAVTRYDGHGCYTQSIRALEYLHADNLKSRTTSNWTLGQAHEQKGDLVSAVNSYEKAISLGMSSGNYLFAILSQAAIGNLLETENKLNQAAETYENVLEQIGKQPLPVLSDVYLGLARIHYQWNNLEKADDYCETSIQLARKFEKIIDRFIVAELFSVLLKMNSGDLKSAEEKLISIKNTVQNESFKHRIRSVADVHVILKIKQNDLKNALQIASENDLSLSLCRVFLAAGDASAALEILEPKIARLEEEKRESERLKIRILYAQALFGNGFVEKSVQFIEQLLISTESEGFIRIYIDEDQLMILLLSQTASRGIMTEYISRILAVYKSEQNHNDAQPLIEPLTLRELEVLDLLSEGLSNKEICDRLFLALDTVKGHNRRIYGKLGVKTRTMAISKARSLNILN